MHLSLAWCDRRLDGVSGRTPKRFLDFQVDGRSLYELIGDDRISCLGWFAPDADEQAAQRLLLNEQPDLDGRTAIYVCPECGDIYCDAITVVVEREAGDMVWRDAAHSSFDWVANEWRHEPLETFPELRFDAQQYAAVIADRPRAR